MNSLWRDIARFWSNVNVSGKNECWTWAGHVRDTYGRAWFNNRLITAHRVAFFIKNGRYPKNLGCHTCDNRLCVNPDHIFDGTYRENIVDSVNKGRHFLSKQTHCKRGHEFNELNTRIENGKRVCKKCSQLRASAYSIGKKIKDITDDSLTRKS